ncbi:substrate-binding domain-containing protein [Streptomyces sp. NPDC050625]|uniref:sugar ABC transporter substrate-binding protein n=1 Tax=Streptomyces sp. NPDC050625 TaxID=3154629 RepID=UPI0034429796
METIRGGRGRRSVGLYTAAAVGLGSLFLAACGANSTAPSSNSQDGSGTQPPAGATEGTIGVILPETATSARWESFDKPFLVKALAAEGYAAKVENAQGDVQKFANLADGMIASQVKALIIASPNAKVGAAVQAKAERAGIPTVDYDRLNAGGRTKYYVSFDNVQVGELQGRALIDALKDKPGAQVIQIEGAPDENNAVLFHRGQMKVLQPLYDKGTLKLVRDRYTPNWDNQLGGKAFEQILTANNGRVDGVIAANDGMAGAVITVLKKNRLNGSVPVTGQDATLSGLQSILRGDQLMTVFKAVKLEADAAAKLAVALANGDTGGADAYAKQTTVDPVTKAKIRSVLLKPQSVGKNEVKQVVDQGYVTAKQLCTADLAKTCAELGIS